MNFADIKLKELKIIKYSRKDNTLKLKILLDVNKKDETLKKDYHINAQESRKLF